MRDEINRLSPSELRAALRMGYNNLNAVKPEFRADLLKRLEMIEDRLRRIQLAARR